MEWGGGGGGGEGRLNKTSYEPWGRILSQPFEGVEDVLYFLSEYRDTKRGLRFTARN